VVDVARTQEDGVIAAALLALALAQVPAGDAAAPGIPSTEAVPQTGQAEGRPSASDRSSLQPLVDRAQPGDRIDVSAGIYDGDLFIDRPLSLIASGHVTLRGSGRGSVVRIRAAGVTLEGFDIDGRGSGDLGRDTSGIHVAARGAVIRRCRIEQALFGIYLREADDATLEDNLVIGIPGRDPGEIGSGIHVWNSQRFQIHRNTVIGTRDGFYIQSSSHGFVSHNRAADLRYGLHYMFSDDNVFEDNVFENGAAGAALMYSNRLAFRRNQFLRNRGFASVGLLLKSCDEVIAEENLLADNARGLFLEGSNRNRFLRNVIAMSDVALVLYDSSSANVFTGNAFIANLTPLSLSGRRTDTRFERNYWSDHREPDLDGDGIADRPYRLSNVFDHLRGNLTAADLFAQSAAAAAIGAAEQVFPVLDPIPVVDQQPLSRMPLLPAVPAAVTTASSRTAASRGLPTLLLVMGGGLLAAAGRSPVGPLRRRGHGGQDGGQGESR
jgi:nitrous oxidase accessory protein